MDRPWGRRTAVFLDPTGLPWEIRTGARLEPALRLQTAGE
ncbi:hypothetical protein [Rhodoglobus aureus]